MNNNNSENLNSDYYIDELSSSNETFVWGIKSLPPLSGENGINITINHPDVLPGIYTIDQNGNVYNAIEDKYLTWSYKKYPYVNLISKDKELVSIYIKDLMAYRYLDNTRYYLERGWRVVNIDGNYSNCNYKNIILIDPSKVQK